MTNCYRSGETHCNYCGAYYESACQYDQQQQNNKAADMRPIPGYPNYSVTANGELYSHKYNKLRLLKTTQDRDGYRYTCARVNGKLLVLKTHKAVALAWLPPRQPHQTDVRHINGKRLDNRAENLTWGTRSENNQDAVRHGTSTQKQATRASKKAAFKRLQQYAAEGYLPLYNKKRLNTKRLKIWLALLRKIKRDGEQNPATQPAQD